MKDKILALLEITLIYLVIRILGDVLRSTGLVYWELEHLGWSYTGMLVFVGVPASFLFIKGRDWSEYGVNLINWQWNLDLGIKAYLVRIIPVAFLLGSTLWLGADYQSLPGGAWIALGELLGIALMLLVIHHSRPDQAFRAARNNLVILVLLLLFPIFLAALLGRLSLALVSTVVWQFFFSGFGEEFVFRGYVQTRLNQVFGRPFCWFGIRFGVGLLITSVLFGLTHAFNTYDRSLGLASLSWGWALFTTFSGLLFGVLREKTGSLLAPGIAHGLPDAVGEALGLLFGWI